MSAFEVDTIKENCRFSDEVTLGENFLLCPAGVPMRPQLIAALQEWGFTEIQSAGHPTEDTSELADLLAGNNPEAAGQTAPSEREAKTEEAPSSTALLDGIRASLKQLADFKNAAMKEKEKLELVQSIYDQYIEYIDTVYTRYRTRGELRNQEIADTVKTLCDFVIITKKYILRIQPAVSTQKIFLVYHSMRSTVLAIVMGMQLGMSTPRLVELGTACVLHEIGMIRLPTRLYLTEKRLSPPEKQQMYIHPVLGYNVLKERGFSMNIALGVLEHHEKEDGSGYPRRLKGNEISVLAKIISVACSFEAITAPRTYKDEENSHKAMIDLLQNTGKQYDGRVVQALLYSLSLYPIGAYVSLSNGKMGVVTDVNPSDPKSPIIQLLGEENTSGFPKTVVAGGGDNRIVNILTPEEVSRVQDPEPESAKP